MATAIALAPGCQPNPNPSTAPLECVPPEAGPPDPCCQPCWLGEECGPDQLPYFPNEEQTRRQWRDTCERVTVAGTCTSGIHFVTLVNVYIADTRYFDSAGHFIGLQRYTDFDPECTDGPRYFPAVIDCEQSATEIICDHRADSLK